MSNKYLLSIFKFCALTNLLFFMSCWLAHNQLSWNVLLFSCNLVGQLCLSGPGYIVTQQRDRTVLTLSKPVISASTSYVGCVCCWFSPLTGFSPGTLVFPFPQKPTLPNSNSIWNAQTRLNEFIWTPMCLVGKQAIFFLNAITLSIAGC